MLRGHDGLERLEVDARGRVVRMLGVTQPVPGENPRLSIDMDLQGQLDGELAGQISRLQHTVDPRTGGAFPAPSGAAVVLDPRDGAVPAIAEPWRPYRSLAVKYPFASVHQSRPT